MSDLFAPVSVMGTQDFCDALKRRREAMGISGEALDDVVGLARGHAVKVENGIMPWGKAAFNMTATASWIIQALGLRLVLMDERDAKRLLPGPEIGARVSLYRPRSGEAAPHVATAMVQYEWPAERF